jgi:hypothetical protein
VTKGKPSDADRLSALIEAKLADVEARHKAGEVPSTTELNAIRRLVNWRDSQREFDEIRELSHPG